MRVLHVLASAKRRGAEMFAADLIPLLGKEGVAQRVAVIQANSSPQIDYGVPTALLDENGAKRGAHRHGHVLVFLKRELGKWPPDVIQAHGGDALKYSVPLALSQRIPVVYRNIGLAAPWATRGLRRAMYSWLMHRTAGVVALAEAVRHETIHTFRLGGGRVVTIPNAVDPRRMEPVTSRTETRFDLSVPADAKVILSLASLSWEKDPLGHVEIGARVLARNPQAVHLLVGDGPMREEIEDTIRSRNLEGRMIVLGSRSDVADLFAASDVLIFASRPDGMEGLPTILIEAGMAGVPVVAYSVAGVREVVFDDESGSLVSPGDIESFATSVSELLSNEAKRRTLGESARSICLAKFDIRHQVPAYMGIYEDLLDV